MSEKSLVTTCCEVAEHMGCVLEVVGQRKAKGSGTTIGAPDALLSCSGRYIPIEFKTAEGRLTLAQKALIVDRQRCGVETAVIRGVDEFIDLVNRTRRRRWSQTDPEGGQDDQG